jgi:hypothetical protein
MSHVPEGMDATIRSREIVFEADVAAPRIRRARDASWKLDSERGMDWPGLQDRWHWSVPLEHGREEPMAP